MLQNLKNRDYIQKLLSADSSDMVHDLWWDKPDGLFIKCVDTVDGKYYEYSYWEDYFGETDYYRFREVTRQPVTTYEWE